MASRYTEVSIGNFIRLLTDDPSRRIVVYEETLRSIGRQDVIAYFDEAYFPNIGYTDERRGNVVLMIDEAVVTVHSLGQEDVMRYTEFRPRVLSEEGTRDTLRYLFLSPFGYVVRLVKDRQRLARDAELNRVLSGINDALEVGNVGSIINDYDMDMFPDLVRGAREVFYGLPFELYPNFNVWVTDARGGRWYAINVRGIITREQAEEEWRNAELAREPEEEVDELLPGNYPLMGDDEEMGFARRRGSPRRRASPSRRARIVNSRRRSPSRRKRRLSR